MGIPLGPLREALAASRKISPDWAKATKKTMRVLHNEGQTESLTGMLKGKFDWNAEATLDDMMYPSRKTAAGYAKDGYSAASMAKLPKGTVTNRAGSGFVPDPRPAGLARIQSDLAFLKRNPGAESRPAPTARNMTSAQKGAIDARKGKKKDKSWPVAPWGSLPSHGKKSGPKGGMR